jgi:hypothetical protein
MEYTSDQIKKIVNLGTLGYGLEKCLNVLDVEDPKQFAKDFDNPDSVVGKAYKKGRDIADFAIDSKLFEMARQGDINAMREFERKKRIRENKQKP